MTPAKKSLELRKDQEIKASVPYEWKSGQWTTFRLQVRKIKDGQCKVEGNAWIQGGAEPSQWMIVLEEKDEPLAGRASVFASPFSATRIQFDDLVVSAVEAKERK